MQFKELVTVLSNQIYKYSVRERQSYFFTSDLLERKVKLVDVRHTISKKTSTGSYLF
jgi:hypothetical protein